MSIPSRDWVVKIDYSNGTGDGKILWRLDQGGDFTINNNLGDPYPCCSAQRYLSIFDNGSSRCQVL